MKEQSKHSLFSFKVNAELLSKHSTVSKYYSPNSILPLLF
jgi:hypothetical protein